MDQINQNEKTLVFCATQDHALAVRDLINQMKTSTDPNYCQQVRWPRALALSTSSSHGRRPGSQRYFA
jgi:type I site-specific restriction endonuclease